MKLIGCLTSQLENEFLMRIFFNIRKRYFNMRMIFLILENEFLIIIK